MARALMVKTKTFVLSSLRGALDRCRCFHKVAVTGIYDQQQPKTSNHSNNIDGDEEEEEEDSSSSKNWVPHPRSGIYSPKGHEWVLNDVPQTAASLNQTYWLRNNVDDAIDKPNSADTNSST